jgi:hypothetical protein
MTTRNVTVIPARKRIGNSAKAEELPKLRVAAYCRVSTDSEEQATSYEAQIEHYTNYIKSNCTAPHFVNTVRQHFVEYFAGNIQPGLNIPELNGYGGCYRNLCKPLSR